MSTELQDMIADVVAETGIDLSIASHSSWYAQISKVNGDKVCAARVREDVARLQQAFEAHPRNYYVVGPAFASMANPAGGRRYQFDLPWLYQNGMIEDECPRIQVSVPE
jgi:hypothetical protein